MGRAPSQDFELQKQDMGRTSRRIAAFEEAFREDDGEDGFVNGLIFI